MIAELEYKGEIKDKRCAICKLTFRDSDTILSCPTCQSLFHEDHFIEWLEINSECPVCERDFSEIINKYSIKPEDEIEPAETSWIDSQPLRDIRFNNIDKDPTEKADIIGLIISGVFFGLVPLVVLALVIPFPDNIPGVGFCYFFFIGGSVCIRFGLNFYKQLRDNPWDYLLFEENSIKITKNDLPTRELTAEDISTIKLNRDHSDGRNLVYQISLEITTSNQVLTFNTIYKSSDSRIRDQYYQYLERLITTRYNIAIQSSSALRRWFDNNKKYILLINIAFVILSAILITISYFLI